MFDYEALWKEEAKAKAAQNEAAWHWELKEARMQELIGEDWRVLLADAKWVANENERRAKKNEEFWERYPVSYEVDERATWFSNQNKLAKVIHSQSWNPKRNYKLLRERFIACCLILDLNWSDYKFLTIQEIAEMTGLSRQKVRSLVDVLLDGHYLKPVKSGFRKVRKAYR